jgi:signal transducing adaptor molecule
MLISVYSHSLQLLDACVSNCGLSFHLEIASREFEQEFRKILHRTQEKTIRDKLLGCLEKWALNEFKTDPQLNLIPSMYNKLKHAGAEFPSQADESPSKKKHGHKSKSHSSSSGGTPSVNSSASAAAKEEADLAKGIAGENHFMLRNSFITICFINSLYSH